LKALLTSAKSLRELGEALPYMVVSWVTQHLLVEDRKIGCHLEKRGHTVTPITPASGPAMVGPIVAAPISA
jgi:hemerythrin